MSRQETKMVLPDSMFAIGEPKRTTRAPSQSSKRTAEEAKFAEYEARAHQDYVNAVNLQLSTMGGSVVVMLEGLGRTINGFMHKQGFWESANTGEKIALMHSELSEALEADRKSLTSDHIPDFTGVEEELADCVIRILDYAAEHDLRLGLAVIEKMRYNLSRPFKHGKKY